MSKLKAIIISIITIIIFLFTYFICNNVAEPKAYDFMVKNFVTNKFKFDTHKQTYGSEDVVLVIIDSKTVEKYRWPWKREEYSKVLNYLSEYASAKVIVHDAIIAALDSDHPNSDKKFFNTVNKIPNLIEGFLPNFDTWDKQNYDKQFVEKFGVQVENHSTPTKNLFESMVPLPIPYMNAVNNIGSVALISGDIRGNTSYFMSDETIRNYEYLFKYSDGFLPSIALKTYLIAMNNPKIVFFDNSIKFPELNYNIETRNTYWQKITPLKFYKLYESGYSHKNYSAVDIIDSYTKLKKGEKPIINPEIFKDKIVIFGANVPAGTGLNDNKNTPISANHPGADIQATAIDNIMHNDFLKVIPDWINLLITLLGMGLVYGFIRISNLTKSIIITLLIIFGYILLSATCFYYDIVINVLTPVIMFVLTTIIAYTRKFVVENKNKEKVKSAMGKYISQDVMKRVIQNIDNLGLGGKKATVTVLFADIRGFTSMSEQMSAQQVSEILNEYFTEIEPIITKYNGVINKFIGDAVMAIFGEPIQDKNHAKNAVKCAYAMLEKVQELQKKWVKEGKPKIEIGIGINTGEVFVGNIGSVNRMEYTVIGDTVNLASRLESYNKVYKTKLLISASTYEEVKGFSDVIKIPEVQIRGKAHKIDIYEVLKVTL
jgi:adenylate cyclase